MRSPSVVMSQQELVLERLGAGFGLALDDRPRIWPLQVFGAGRAPFAPSCFLTRSAPTVTGSSHTALGCSRFNVRLPPRRPASPARTERSVLPAAGHRAGCVAGAGTATIATLRGEEELGNPLQVSPWAGSRAAT